MDLFPDDADLHVPDGAAPSAALARTTDLGIVAHADDLEFGDLAPIAACHGVDDRWFGGVVCTDGAGSARTGAYAELSAAELVELRRREQRAAADIGEYAFVAQLRSPSTVVRSEAGQAELVALLREVLLAARPVNVYTHNLADKHATHVAIGAAVVKAVRLLPMDARPSRLVGVEAWRDLDWLADHEKLRMDVSEHVELGGRLTEVFASQLADKRYDIAAAGRRRANATMSEPRTPDDAEEVVVAMDLTALARNDDVDPVRYVTASIDRFRRDVEQLLRPHF